MPRYAASTDENQSEIVAALRKVGASVAITAGMGAGFPDLVVGFKSRNHLFEVKDHRKRPSERKLTPDQQLWHAAWKGTVLVVETIDQALAAIGVCPPRNAEGSISNITARPTSKARRES